MAADPTDTRDTYELCISDLHVHAGPRALLQCVSLTVRTGEIVALVGSSGSGKSVTTRSILGLLPPGLTRTGGRIELHTGGPGGRTTREIRSEADHATLRGPIVGLLFQDARAALDPLWTVGRQVAEAARLADPRSPADPLPWLRQAGFPAPDRVAGLYPHELSGGMAQRVLIATGLARRSRLLLADEPTTGLDPSVQRAILDQLRTVVAGGTGLLFITHDLRLLPGFADRIVVMAGGRIVEEAPRVQDLTGAGRALVEATRKVAGGAF